MTTNEPEPLNDKREPERVAPHLKLFVEMAGRLDDEDFRDLASYDYPEEIEKNFSRIKRVVDDLDFGNGFTIYPRESLLEYSWKELSPNSIKNQEKRIFACVYLIMNRCADENQWLSFDSTIGSLLESLIIVDPNLLRDARWLFQYVISCEIDEDFKIFASIGIWVDELFHGENEVIRIGLADLVTSEKNFTSVARAHQNFAKPMFAGFEEPIAIYSWHGLRKLLRKQTETVDDVALKGDISNFLDKLWMPTEHNYWKWDQRQSR